MYLACLIHQFQKKKRKWLRKALYRGRQRCLCIAVSAETEVPWDFIIVDFVNHWGTNLSLENECLCWISHKCIMLLVHELSSSFWKTIIYSQPCLREAIFYSKRVLCKGLSVQAKIQFCLYLLALVTGPHTEELIIKYLSCWLQMVGASACSEMQIKMLTGDKFWELLHSDL